MATIDEVFNGDPKETSGNVIRGSLAVGIPAILGFVGSVLESCLFPGLGIAPLAVTFAVPLLIGAAEMIRQTDILHDKNAESRINGEIENIRRIGIMHRNIDRKK